ncbi:MAG: serine/threonine-protein kinase [Chloroflexota bacterium]
MDLSGQTLGKYELLHRLGKGGMAEVYLANQPTIERQVAIKVLHRHLAEDEDFILRFKREARSLGQLQHPNIVNIYDFDSHEDVYFMVMDYIAGPTLRTYLDEKKILSNEEALRIIAQMVEGLAYAHQKGAVHRDIKPANVMFTDDTVQQAVITDFGITRLMNDQTITVEGSMVGTPAYMSPEAVIGERVDGRADIYSVGVILYEMVTGRTPYEGATPLSLVVKQVHEPLPSPLEFKPDLAVPMVHLIEKALSKEINGRYQTASEFLQGIQQTQNQLNLPIVGATMARTTMPALPQIETPPPPQPEKPTVVKPSAQSTTSGFDWKKAAPFIGGGLVLLAIIAGFLLSRGGNNGQVDAIPTETAVAAVADPTTVVEAEQPPVEDPTPTEVDPVEDDTPPPTEEPPPATAVPPTEEPERIPPVERARTGTASFLSSVVGAIDGLSVDIIRVPAPPPGFQYELSFVDSNGEIENIGPVTVEDQQILFEESADGNQFALYCDLLITLEPDSGSDINNLGETVFSGTMAPEIKDNLLQLLGEEENGRLINLFAQTATAQQHFQFSMDSLSASDFDEAKRHMEHVVNILDGESGGTFGDLNLDGQTQNPGDGVGVRVYLEETAVLLEQIKAAEPVTLERQQLSDNALTAVSSALDLVNTTIQRAAAITATDTPDEASPIYDELTSLMTQLDAGNTAVYDNTLILATIPVTTNLPGLPEPEPITGVKPEQFGVVELFNGPDGTATRYRVRVEQINPAEEGQIIQVWLTNNSSALLLGALDVVQNRAQLSGTVNDNILENFNDVLVTIEEIGSGSTAPTGTVLLQGPVRTPAANLIVDLLAPQLDNGKGPIFGLEEQLALAIQHFGFAQTEIAAGNFDGAKIHFEHVINILDGGSGAFFGDLNGDGQTQNPGDDVGVRVYFEQIQTAVSNEGGQSRNQEFILNQLSAMITNNLTELEFAMNQGSKIFASDTLEEAQPFVDTLAVQFEILQNGRDLDDSNTIEPLFNEGGIQIIKDTLTTLNEIPLNRVE